MRNELKRLLSLLGSVALFCSAGFAQNMSSCIAAAAGNGDPNDSTMALSQAELYCQQQQQQLRQQRQQESREQDWQQEQWREQQEVQYWRHLEWLQRQQLQDQRIAHEKQEREQQQKEQQAARSEAVRTSPPFGSDEQTVDVLVPGFTPIHLVKVALARYSSAIAQWLPEFRATREVTNGQISNSMVTLHVALTMRDGRVYKFDATPLVPGSYVYLVDNDRDRYDPHQVVSFLITADTDWAALREVQIREEKERTEAGAEAAKIAAAKRRAQTTKAADRAMTRQNCRVSYQKTKDKKVADLTVAELKRVNACDSLGYYVP